MSIHPEIKSRQLNLTAHIGDDSVMSVSVQNHLWDSGRSKANVSHGQVGEEEVPGGVEVRIRDDSQDDEQVPKHSDQVHGQKHPREKGLQVSVI